MSNVVRLPNTRRLATPVELVIRTGETSYRQLESLHAEGRLSAARIVVDGSKAHFQKEFVALLREQGVDVILDPKIAELSEFGRFQGLSRTAPWAPEKEHGPLSLEDFRSGSNFDIFGKIARQCVEAGVSAVLSPSHFLRDGCDDEWFAVDQGSLDALRNALDRSGGRHISIDYSLIVPHTLFQNQHQRGRLIKALSNLQFDNLFLRLSGFGASAQPLSVKRTFLAVGDLAALGRPVVLDHVGGLVGLGSMAFGFASAIATGIGEHDSFDARTWHVSPKPRVDGTPFGRTTYIPVPGLDRSFSKKDIAKLANAVGGRRLITCQDKVCCPDNLNSMIEKFRAHIATQKLTAIVGLSRVPDTHRAGHFLQNDMRNAERKAGDLARLKTGDAKLDASIARGRRRIDSMARMFETLSEAMRPASPAMIRDAQLAANDRGSR